MTTTTLATVDARTDRAAFEPANLSEALHVSQVLVASRLLPRSISTPEAAFAVIATGRELGLSAMQALRAIHIVEGKPTLSADLMVGLVKRSEACAFFRLVESTGAVATYETHRRGEPSPTRLSFTLDEAKAAGVASKDNWRRYPAAMLRARCAAALARAVYPDLVLGVYDPDELNAPLPPVDVTPAPVVAPPVAVLPPEPVVEPAPRAAPAARRRSTKPEPVAEPAVATDDDRANGPRTPELEGEPEPVAELDTAAAAARRAIESADTLPAAVKVFAAAGVQVDARELPALFEQLLARCGSLVETNEAAGVLVSWKQTGVHLPENVSTLLRGIYNARRSALREGGR